MRKWTRGGLKYAELAKDNNENHLIALKVAGAFTPRGFGVTAQESTINKFRWLPHFDMNINLF